MGKVSGPFCQGRQRDALNGPHEHLGYAVNHIIDRRSVERRPDFIPLFRAISKLPKEQVLAIMGAYFGGRWLQAVYGRHLGAALKNLRATVRLEDIY